MGKPPLELSPRSALVSCVAFHPRMDVLAIGYDDGEIILTRLEDHAEINITAASGSPATKLAWSKDGTMLAFACENGQAGLRIMAS